MASVPSASASFLSTKSNTAMSFSAAAHRPRLVFSRPCSVSRPSRSRLNISVVSASRFDRHLSGKFKGFHISKRPSISKSSFAEVIAHGSSNNTTVATASSAVPSTEGNGEEEDTGETSSASTSAVSDVSISAFMSEAMNYAKQVDASDIIELKLKHKGCELLIRKKEALPTPPAPPTQYMPPPYPVPSVSPPAQTHTSSKTDIVPSSSPPVPAKPSHADKPCIKSPMAGTFYRSPAPGEPAFVKVGDKVQKGNVICIVEAMKLMNEIEADQSGTIVEILAEDGKAVSVDTPLFVIKP